MRMYAIINSQNNNDMWSNSHGWTGEQDFDLFTETEKTTLNLPIGGAWVYMCGGNS